MISFCVDSFFDQHKKVICGGDYSGTAKLKAASLFAFDAFLFSSLCVGIMVLEIAPWKVSSALPHLSVAAVIAVYAALLAIGPLVGSTLGLYCRTEADSIKLRSVCTGSIAFFCMMGIGLSIIALTMTGPSISSISDR